jgi:16S rRNA C967 or C1407 C5-methylase (RsmB/RsmF family)
VIADFLLTHEDATLEDIDLGLSGCSWWTHWLASFGKNTHYPDILGKAVRILPSDETEGFFIVKIRKV